MAALSADSKVSLNAKRLMVCVLCAAACHVLLTGQANQYECDRAAHRRGGGGESNDLHKRDYTRFGLGNISKGCVGVQGVVFTMAGILRIYHVIGGQNLKRLPPTLLL